MGKLIAIVTGASSGIGKEFVRQLDSCLKNVEEIWVIARRIDKLNELKASMQNINLRVLPLDICEDSNLEQFQRTLQQYQPKVRLLINAAGVGRAGRFDLITKGEISNMIQLNNKALVLLTHIVLPYMVSPSNIIQIASASAFLPQKEFAVYAASKAFVLSFSRALSAELKNKNIHVTIVCPGPVNTEFLSISNAGREEKRLKKLVTTNVEPVVSKALRDAKNGKEISIYGVPMKTIYVLSKILPHSIFIR